MFYFGFVICISFDPEFNDFVPLKKEFNVALPNHLFSDCEQPKIGQAIITLITHFSKNMQPRFCLFKLLDFNILNVELCQNDSEKKKYVCQFVKDFINNSKSESEESNIKLESGAINHSSKVINQYCDNDGLNYDQKNMSFSSHINPINASFTMPIDDSLCKPINSYYSFGQPMHSSLNPINEESYNSMHLYKNDLFNPMFQQMFPNYGSNSIDPRLG